MPRINGLRETALYVGDFERSVDFYQSVLGFEVIDSSERGWALSVAGRQVLLIFKRGATEKPHETLGGTISPHGASGAIHVAFAIAAEEFDTWERWLVQNGVAIESKVTWPRGGRSLYFRDPDGHSLELATPGTRSIY